MSSLSPGWNTEGTVAVVTGAGHGIGFHIASQLANDAGMQVLVTSRDIKNAQSAAELIGNGCVGTQLDIADVSKAVPEFARWIQEQYGGIDVLVNNASIAFHRDAFSGPEAKQTMDTNVHGTVALTESLKPLIPRNAGGDGRIVILSSASGEMALKQTSGAAREKMAKAATADDIRDIATDFAQAVADNTYAGKGYSASMYGSSKLLEALYARVLQNDFQQQGKHGVVCTAAHPGSCMSKMNPRGRKSSEEGADTPTWLVLQPKDAVTPGGYYADRSERMLEI